MKCLKLAINIVRKSCALQRHQTLYTSTHHFHPRFQTSGSKTPETPEKKTDVEILEQIEQNLFENPNNQAVHLQKEQVLKFASKSPIKKSKPPSPKEVVASEDHRYDEKLGLNYKQFERHDKRIGSIMSMNRNKSTLERDNKICVEGARLIDDALETGLKLRTLLFSRFEQVHRIRNRLVMNEKAGSGHELIKIEQSDMKIWSTLTTAPGIIGIFDRPKQALKLDHADLPITVICDQIREPNNLGSIIRVCAGIPCQQIICTKGTADPWSAKCLRGGFGGHFRTPIKQMDWNQIKDTLPKDSYYFIAENNVLRNSDAGLKSSPYHDINLEGFVISNDDPEKEKSHVVVVIGGETHGVSEDAFRYQPNIQAPVCVHIPLANNMDSLNSASAISIILFEIRRKLQLQANNKKRIEDDSSDSDGEGDRKRAIAQNRY